MNGNDDNGVKNIPIPPRPEGRGTIGIDDEYEMDMATRRVNLDFYDEFPFGRRVDGDAGKFLHDEMVAARVKAGKSARNAGFAIIMATVMLVLASINFYDYGTPGWSLSPSFDGNDDHTTMPSIVVFSCAFVISVTGAFYMAKNRRELLHHVKKLFMLLRERQCLICNIVPRKSSRTGKRIPYCKFFTEQAMLANKSKKYVEPEATWISSNVTIKDRGLLESFSSPWFDIDDRRHAAISDKCKGECPLKRNDA